MRKNLYKTVLCPVVIMLVITSVQAQYIIKANVIDHASEIPLQGANVGIAGTFFQTQSDSEGLFTIKNVKDTATKITISYLGYRDTSLSIGSIIGNNTVIRLRQQVFQSQEVIVNATRASKLTAGTFNEVSKANIKQINVGQDIPMLLNSLPSVVSGSDAGNGVGYTAMSIRGSDATRTNVTINGIPVNDAESHGTFWVNIPDLAASAENIQVQRGVGTSTNGAAAFGATVNIQTKSLSERPYAEVNNSIGSFNTRRHSLSAGTGLLGKKFILDARLSQIASDGYIDRASSDLKSFFISAGYFGKSTIVKANIFSGKEKTYQAWNGVPFDSLETNRKFNPFTYENQTDNYQQDYYQLFLTQELGYNLDFNLALFYTRGRGYYEEFREQDNIENYGLSSQLFGDTTLTNQNLVRQRWLDNHFFGFTFSGEYRPFNGFKSILGGGVSIYDGDHFGKIIWQQFAIQTPINFEYYRNASHKSDGNLYLKFQYTLLKKVNLFADIQARGIDYSFWGFNELLQPTEQRVRFLFFNPKVGISIDINPKSYFYTSFSLANREPVRADFVDNPPSSRPKHEQLSNLEVGIKYNSQKWTYTANAYGMWYRNQLVVTGKINDVGAYIRQNVDESYRIGFELQTSVRILKPLVFQANLSLSENRIRTFKEFIDDYDNGGQISNTYTNSPIALSPSMVSYGSLHYSLIRKNNNHLELCLTEKFVGRQFLDNTGNVNRSLPSFFVNDLRLNYSCRLKWVNEISVIIAVNNLFNVQYAHTGYTYSFIYEGLQTFNFAYPQAGRNYMVGLGLKF